MIHGRTLENPQRRVINKRDFVLNASIHNRFDIEVLDAKTGTTKGRAQAFNVICNKLWNIMLANSTGYFRCIHYGSGAGTPSTADTSLFNFVGWGYANPMTIDVDFEKGLIIGKGTYQLSASTAVGVTITEVGIAGDTGANTLCTHAMLQDMNGNPISIAKTDTDVINIYATVYVHFNPEGYDNGCIRIIGDEWNSGGWTWGTRKYDLMPLLVGSHNSHSGCSVAMFAGHYTENGLGSYQTVSVKKSFDIQNRRITLTPGRLENTVGNFEGISFLAFGEGYSSGYLLRPEISVEPGGSWFSHSEIVGEAVGTGDGSTKDFSLDFPYARDVKVFVDGVEQSGFTVDYGDPRAMKSNYESYRPVKWLRPESTDNNHIPLMPRFYNTNGLTCDNNYLFYNKMHEVGLASIRCRKGAILYTSNDLIDWVELGTSANGGDFAIPQQYMHNKYFKSSIPFYSDNTSQTGAKFLKFPATFTGNVLHLQTPPAAGAVITADYRCDCIAKDANHVFDVSLTIQLGEYTEAQ